MILVVFVTFKEPSSVTQVRSITSNFIHQPWDNSSAKRRFHEYSLTWGNTLLSNQNTRYKNDSLIWR